ncbi:MAG: sugar phosphate isomerase/epimerase [candidate division KSB1 bacterium]|nr:sugar phosphate isomerase/epimerase [candidate division KSB1 bacterium]
MGLFSRRAFLRDCLLTSGAVWLGASKLLAAPLERFRLGILTDEVSQDPERAMALMRDLRLNWVELRTVWGKHVIFLDSQERRELRELLARYGLFVSNIAAPTYKTAFPGTTPIAKEEGEEYEPRVDPEEVLWRAIDTARYFNVPFFRAFTFWRVADSERPKVMPEILEVFRRAVKIAERNGTTLLVENEYTTNVATGAEAAAFIREFDSPFLGLLWDPGNAVFAGEKSFREGYEKIPKDRIHHIHLKDALVDPTTGRRRWAVVGQGQVDFVGQFAALVRDRYRGTLSLETHLEQPNREQASLNSMLGVLDCIRKA